MTATVATTEDSRDAILRTLAAQGAKADDDFAALMALAVAMLDCPAAAVTMVDRDHQWLLAGHGDVPERLPIEHSFCAHTIAGDDALVVPDLSEDDRFAASPLVRVEGLRFYAGIPIRVRDDRDAVHNVGALCVVDHVSRSFDDRDHRILNHLRSLAESLIAARSAARRAIELAALADRQAAELKRNDCTFRQAERMAMMGSWHLQLADDDLQWSDGIYRIHGYEPVASPRVEGALVHYPPVDRGRIAEALAECIDAGRSFDLELDFTDARGTYRRVRSMGEREDVDGRPVALIGVFQDVTERHALELRLRHSADHDMLTGLLNRAAFDRRLVAAMADAESEGSPLTLFLMDLDGFKAINDTLGHLAGDDVLQGVGRCLAEPWLGGCAAVRLGGDEFALIATAPAFTGDPPALVTRLEQALRQQAIGPDGLTLIAGASVGFACHRTGMTPRDLIQAADASLYANKRRRVGDRRRRAA